MATTEEFDIIFDAKYLPTRNWYHRQLDRELWQPHGERARAVDYARALEEATKHTRLFEQARRLADLTDYHSIVEQANLFDHRIPVSALLHRRKIAAETHERGAHPEVLTELTAPIEEAVEVSRYILDIEENWDEEGSPGYSEATWRRATQFVRDIFLAFVVKYRRRIEPPRITPGPDGSIDVRWRAEKRTLLVNFPANEHEPADFFGSDKGSDTIKGTLDLTSQNQWLLLWLMR